VYLPLLPEEHLLLDAQVRGALAHVRHDVQRGPRQLRRRRSLALSPLHHLRVRSGLRLEA
jgi:hypothetical protein